MYLISMPYQGQTTNAIEPTFCLFNRLCNLCGLWVVCFWQNGFFVIAIIGMFALQINLLQGYKVTVKRKNSLGNPVRPVQSNSVINNLPRYKHFRPVAMKICLVLLPIVKTVPLRPQHYWCAPLPLRKRHVCCTFSIVLCNFLL